MLTLLAHLFTPRHSNNHRPRIIHPEGFFVLTTLLLVFSIVVRATPTVFPSVGTVLGYSSSITASQVLSAINAERTKAGLPTLTNNSKLSEAALAKANNMFTDQYWAHASPTGTLPWNFIHDAGYEYTIAGENLARDFSDTDSMVSAWMASPTHKDNIVQKKYSETGIAVVDGQLLGSQTTLVVQLFGTPANTASNNQQLTTNKTGQTPAAAFATTSVLGNSAQVSPTPFFSPTQLFQSLALAMLTLLIGVLLYDALITSAHKTVRTVGKNLAHMSLFVVIFILVAAFKVGMLL